MADDSYRDVAEMTVAELRERATALEITGRSSMNKEELRQAVLDAEAQIAEEEPGAEDEWTPQEDAIEEEPAEERLAEHEPSDVDAMGLDKRRGVVGHKYGASFAKQVTVYGVFLAVVAALVIGGKLAIDELDKGPEVNEDKAPWSGSDRATAPIDFPRSVTP